jgi:hypothetical protein
MVPARSRIRRYLVLQYLCRLEGGRTVFPELIDRCPSYYSILRAEWSRKVSTVSGGIFRCTPPVAAATAVPPPAPTSAPNSSPRAPAGVPADQSTCTHAGSAERPATLAATLRSGYCCGHWIAFAVEHDRIHLQIDLFTSTDPVRLFYIWDNQTGQKLLGELPWHHCCPSAGPPTCL